jgi:hypothetical protein
LKKLGFRFRNFLAQLLSETSAACTIRVRRSSLGRLWNNLGSHACLHHRNRRPGTSIIDEYLAAENRILRAQIKGRLLLSDAEKATLAEIAHRLGRKALEELAAVGAELKAKAHLFRYFFADRHDIQENETMKLT